MTYDPESNIPAYPGSPAGDRQPIVVLSGQPKPVVYGPFLTASDAVDFAEFLTAEVDPAEVQWMADPARELMSWRAAHLANYGAPEARP